MKLLVQNSLKMGLQLKRYEVLKLQGLDCVTPRKFKFEEKLKYFINC
jgi:hypothetical protein